MAHVLSGFGVEIAEFAQRQNLRHLDVLEAAALLRECGKQRGWFTHASRYNNKVAVALLTQGIVSGDAFALVNLLK